MASPRRHSPTAIPEGHKSIMVVSREVAAGLETALAIALGPKPASDGGEPAQNPQVTMVCKRLDYRESSGHGRGVRHLSPGDHANDVELLHNLKKSPPAGKNSVLILDNILQPAIRRLLPHWGTVIFVTAYPVFSSGAPVTTVVATPTCNAFTWSSLYKTLHLATSGGRDRTVSATEAGGGDEDDGDESFSEESFTEMTKALKKGDVLCCRALSPEASPVPDEPISWSVSAEPLTSVF